MPAVQSNSAYPPRSTSALRLKPTGATDKRDLLSLDYVGELTMFKIKIITAFIGFLASQSILADSAKLFWRGHYYQRFDVSLTTWAQAKAACQGKGAHLATITSSEENDFIYGPVGVSSRAYNNHYSIGATDEVANGTWKWITNEPWNFEYFTPYQFGDYAHMNSLDSHWTSYYSSSTVDGYICEWDGKAVVAIATVNDLNGNGVRENAILYRSDGNNAHTVVIRDPVTHQNLSTLTFGGSINPPLGLAVVSDMNGNGRQEIAVLNGNRSVMIKDAKYNNEILSTITFLDSKYIPLSIAVKPDQNGNSGDEITVIGSYRITAGKVKTETRDSKTKAVLASDMF